MPITDILPRRKENDRQLAVRRSEDPFLTFQEEMNRLLDDFMGDPFRFSLTPRSLISGADFTTRVDVSEDDKQVVVTADLPGLDEKDVTVSYDRGVLSIAGEKRAQREEKDQRYHRIERSYGSFRREIGLPCEVEEDKITATFSKGELKVVLPKSGEAVMSGKRIPVAKGD